MRDNRGPTRALNLRDPRRAVGATVEELPRWEATT